MTIVILTFAAPSVAEDRTVELPVSRIVLFSSGVGYFEHVGELDGPATVKLMFKTEQINDVLKSMVVMDPSGGATSVNYASRDPIVRALQSFAVDLSGDPALADIIKQLRGADVTLQAPEKITGKILGIETQTRQVNTPGGSTILKESVLNLLTAEGVKAVPVSTLQNLQLTDRNLRGEIDKALKLILASSDKQRKGVEVRFAGKGKREVRIGYVTETPVWKVSYRLELSGDKPLLQGWAIVENTSDQDWSNVQLALVSGRPISFIQELYTPLYLPRPVVQPELYASLRPQEYEEGMKGRERLARAPTAAGEEMADRGGEAEAEAAPALAAAPLAAGKYAGTSARGEVLFSTVQAAASAGKVGELFHFEIKEPVSLSRRRSAMLPILSGPIAAEKVSIYNPRVLAKNPLNGAWITNDTGMKMLGGPVTVFDDHMYAGDARLGNLGEKDKRLLSYAVDLNMTVDPSEKTSAALTAAKIVKGVMTLTYLHRFTQTYKIENKADRNATLILEHPFFPDRKLIDPTKFEEKTPELYRFAVLVKKGSMLDFPVIEEQVQYQTLRLIDQNEQALLYYAKTAEISPKARQALQQAAEMKRNLAVVEQKLAELTKQKAQIEAGQDRLRKNIESVGRDSTLGKRYIQKLSAEEDQLENLAKEIESTQAQRDQLRKAFEDFIAGMNF
jgi:hypothetical protein